MCESDNSCSLGMDISIEAGIKIIITGNEILSLKHGTQLFGSYSMHGYVEPPSRQTLSISVAGTIHQTYLLYLMLNIFINNGMSHGIFTGACPV